jgi:hypothetical protein
MTGFKISVPFQAFALVLLSVKGAIAHGHDMSKIQEGEGMSAEPLVGTMEELRWHVVN